MSSNWLLQEHNTRCLPAATCAQMILFAPYAVLLLKVVSHQYDDDSGVSALSRVLFPGKGVSRHKVLAAREFKQGA